MANDLQSLAEAQERTRSVRDEAARVLRGEWNLKLLRQQIDTANRVHARELWSQLRSLEWDRVLTADSAMGMPDLCAMTEQVGFAVAPVPLVGAAIGARLVGGQSRHLRDGFVVLANREAAISTSGKIEATAARVDTGYRLRGTKVFIPWGGEAAAWVVTANIENENAIGLFIVERSAPGLKTTELAALDWWPLAEIQFDDVEVSPEHVLAVGDVGVQMLADAQDRETLASCAELVGVAARAHAMAVEYALLRTAFDRPIGAFQAIKHRLVDLRADIELGRALTAAAALAVDQAAGGGSAAVARAAFWCSEALRKTAEGALQVFGGIGYTWEHDLHFLLRRSATLVALLGERATYRGRIVEDLLAQQEQA